MNERGGDGGGASLLVPILACLTLGLAPFVPMPHLVEKLIWLGRGESFRPIDVFDLLLHGSPWVWLVWATIARMRQGRRS